MEKRISKRPPINLEAEIISDGESYEVCIGDISENGVYAEILHAKTVLYFTPGTKFELELQLPSGATLNLNCKVKWSTTLENIFQNIINKVGLEIIDPPLEYKEIYESLSGPMSF